MLGACFYAQAAVSAFVIINLVNSIDFVYCFFRADVSAYSAVVAFENVSGVSVCHVRAVSYAFSAGDAFVFV